MSTNPNIDAPHVARWLSIVGIGEDGIEGLSELARKLIASAEQVFGGERHLSLARALIRGQTHSWTRPFEESVARVLAHRGRPVCVLASGDPFQHGVGSVLARQVSPEETQSVPAVSAFSLAASRLLWSLPEITLLSLCGRSPDLLRSHLQPGARILVLTSGSAAPKVLADLLCSTGFGSSRLTVLEALGGPRERVRSSRASDFHQEDIGPLNTVAIEAVADPQARILPRATGLADDLFEHDGQITKREIRALTVSSLAPRQANLLWDIGAGSGSVAIEWMLADPSLSAVAIERRPDRAARIRRNAAAFGVPHLEVIEAEVSAALPGLQPPDAVFIGGGATVPGLVESVQRVLRPHGRLVINAVTLETEALLLDAQARYGGSLIRMEIQRARAIGGEDGRFMSWQSARPITQWTWTRSS